MLLKQKNPSFLRNFVLRTFGELLIVFLTKVSLLYLLYSMVQRCCLLPLIKENSLLETFLKTLILMTSVSLCLFSILELIWHYIIFLTPKMVKKSHNEPRFIKGIWSWSYSLVVLNSCEPELSYTLPDLFNMCLKESCFPDCWKVSLVVPVFKNIGERSTAKNYRPVSLLSVVSKSLKNL